MIEYIICSSARNSPSGSSGRSIQLYKNLCWLILKWSFYLLHRFLESVSVIAQGRPKDLAQYFFRAMSSHSRISETPELLQIQADKTSHSLSCIEFKLNFSTISSRDIAFDKSFLFATTRIGMPWRSSSLRINNSSFAASSHRSRSLLSMKKTRAQTFFIKCRHNGRILSEPPTSQQ